MFNKFLFIYDLAQNHAGDVNKALNIIRQIGSVSKKYSSLFDFCFKFQYRQLDTFINPNYQDRIDLKYVKRFKDCQLTEDEFLTLKKEIESFEFLSGVTCFDNESVIIAEKQNFDILKVASVSLTDFPLLEEIIKTNKPIILSTAAAKLNDIDNVVEFMQNRNKNFALMHCISEYPVNDDNLQLNQVDLLKERYKNIPIGFSSHQDPNVKSTIDSIKMAIAKNSMIYEVHVDIDDETRNKYSRNVNEIELLLQSAEKSFLMCGVKNERYTSTQKEKDDLKQFRRGIFANKDLTAGIKLNREDIFFAFPYIENQISANDWRKYYDFNLLRDIKKNEPIYGDDVEVFNRQDLIRKIYEDVKNFLIESKVVIPEKLDIDISHHYGLNNFYKFGAALITIINDKEYAKKLIIILPNQKHPQHFHHVKKESFLCVYGELELTIVNKDKTCSYHILKSGDSYTVERKVPHSFTSKTGSIFEEISTEAILGDSYYEDFSIMKNKDRKTLIKFNK